MPEKEKNRFSLSVAFNNKKEKDLAILKYVKRRNFSGYVKKLILEDIAKTKPELLESKPIKQIEQVKMEESKPMTMKEQLQQQLNDLNKKGEQ